MSSMGRSLGQRGEKIEPIQNLEHRNIVFSKYKQKLFKKAAELSTVYGADTAIVLFSPQGKDVYSFGSPSVDSTFNRFLNQNPEAKAQYLLDKASRHEVENQLKAEKKRGKLLNAAHKRLEDHYFNRLSWDELRQLKGNLEALKKGAVARHKELQKEADAAAASSSMSDDNGPPAEETDDETDIYHSP